MKKNRTIIVILVLCANIIFFASCKKESGNQIKSENQSNLIKSTDLLGVLRTKTGGGKIAISINSSVATDERSSIAASIFPAQPHFIYDLLSAKWWKWALELPLPGHPFIDDPSFNITTGQTGQLWFLAAPFGTVERTCVIPRDHTLFIGLLNAEASDLEGLGNTAADQRANAKFLADHIINLTFSIDGHNVSNIASYRYTSPQFQFNAPTPWIEGPTGGAGTSVADGYYVMVKPMFMGRHTIHYSGAFHFAVAEGDPFDFDASLDMTYHLVQE